MAPPPGHMFYSVRVYYVIISKYAMKIIGTQNRHVAYVQGTRNRVFHFGTFSLITYIIKPTVF